MPKIPNRQKNAEPDRMPLRQFVEGLEELRLQLWEVHQSLHKLTAVFYKQGFDDRGPIVEDKSDCPF